jgi:hypothetical protein
MKTLVFACILIMFAATAAGQSIVLRDTILSSEVPVPTASDWTKRDLERIFNRPRSLRDRITVRLLSISNALGADGITKGGLYWRANNDGMFRIRSSKFQYRYSPREFPHDTLTFLDRAFGIPIRLVTSKTLSF